MADFSLTIRGLQQTQRANLENIAAMQPAGIFGLVIRDATIEAHSYEVSIVHVDTGALRASQRIDVRGLVGKVYTDPSAVRPGGGRPAIYGYHEHKRGGTHAYAERTVRERGHIIARNAEDRLIRGLA